MAHEPLPADCARLYRVIRPIASGGFGTVWEAEQLALGRLAAVKVLRAEVLDDKEQAGRFDNEARITASIQHPNVVQVLDHGSESGVPWIAYELMSGDTLREQVDARTLTLPQALAATAQVAEALHAAHARGVLHRDIKPDNVLQAGGGNYKVTDFGIAKWTRESAVKTKTGVILGTPTYLSPEQIGGGPASVASDLYALGVLLFELITGRPPYEADTLFGVLEGHLRAPVPRASALEPGVPREVDELLACALAKHPRNRFQSARAMADALAAVAAGAAPRAPRAASGNPLSARSSASATRALSGGMRTSAIEPRDRAAEVAPRSRVPVALVVALGAMLAVTLVWRSARPAGSGSVLTPLTSPTSSAAASAPASLLSSSTSTADIMDAGPLRRTLNELSVRDALGDLVASREADPLERFRRDLAAFRKLYLETAAAPRPDPAHLLVFAAPTARMVVNAATLITTRSLPADHPIFAELRSWRPELRSGSTELYRRTVETIGGELLDLLIAARDLSWEQRASHLTRGAEAVLALCAERNPGVHEIDAAIGLLHNGLSVITDPLWDTLASATEAQRRSDCFRRMRRLLNAELAPAVRALPPGRRARLGVADQLLADLEVVSAHPEASGPERAAASREVHALATSMMEVRELRAAPLELAARAVRRKSQLASALGWVCLDAARKAGAGELPEMPQVLLEHLLFDWCAATEDLDNELAEKARDSGAESDVNEMIIAARHGRDTEGSGKVMLRAKLVRKRSAADFAALQTRCREIVTRGLNAVSVVCAASSVSAQVHLARNAHRVENLCMAMDLTTAAAQLRAAMLGASVPWLRHHHRAFVADRADDLTGRVAATEAAIAAFGPPPQRGEEQWAARWRGWVLLRVWHAKGLRTLGKDKEACAQLEALRPILPRIMDAGRSRPLVADMCSLLALREKCCDISDPWLAALRRVKQ